VQLDVRSAISLFIGFRIRSIEEQVMKVVVRPSDADINQAQLVEALRAKLADGGPLPPERTLAEELQVNRYRLRRALDVLRASGDLADPPPRRGRRGARRGEAMVRSTNPIEVIELRLALEPALARLAALRATPFDIARIERAATTAAGADSGAADLAFHKLVAAAARNTLAADFYNLLRQVGTDARLRVGSNAPTCPKRLQQRDAEHRAIAQAIASRDADRAETAMRDHLLAVQRTILGRTSEGLQVA
jgi:GntR family transcriptional repressor for pyruvate dehydrogenase complex